MKILIAANNDNGLYKFRKELIENLLKHHQVFISLPYGEYVPKLIEMGCKFDECNFDRHGINPLNEVKHISYYKKLINKIEPDVILTYTIKPNCYCGHICSNARIPYISNITGLGTAIQNGGIIQKIALTMYKIGLRRAHRVFFQNRSNMEFMVEKKVIQGNYEVLPGSGVNLYEYVEKKNTFNDTVYFLFVGRIMKDKGIDEFIDCAKHFNKINNKVKFDIVGEMEEEEYRDIIYDLHDKGIINYFGEQENVKQYYYSHNALIQPSYHEGLSNVLLENAACGRPCISTTVPGCIETFDDGITGIGFEEKNSEALIEAVYKFIALSDEEKDEMGAKARAKVEKCFDRNIIINAYMNAIEECIGEEK